jgi:hypothetical protein
MMESSTGWCHRVGYVAEYCRLISDASIMPGLMAPGEG